LAGSELHSVLLEVMQRRARTRSPTDVLAQYRRDPYCSPAAVDLRESLAVDNHLLTAAREFEAVELSPVAPLGACSTLAITDQNRVLSALRMTELVADPTNVLALECALRMRACHWRPVHLVTSQRVVRSQPVPKEPGCSQHFRIFVLASGGRESKDHVFTVDTVVRHVRTMLGALERLERYGYCFGRRRVDVLATPNRKETADRIAESLGGLATRKTLEHAYYSGGLRYQIWVNAPDGSELPLVDGGVFDWLTKLVSNRRAVYVATGTGAQLIALRFREARTADDGGRVDAGRQASTIDVRVLGAEDAAAFQALRLEALRESPAAFSSSYEEECEIPLSRVVERLSPAPERAVFGAFQSGVLVGTAGLQRERASKLAHKAFIWGVYVTPAARRRGLGRLLLREVLAHAASMPGLRQVSLGVNSANPASIALYESVGFEPFGVEKGFLLVDGVLYDEIHMARVVGKSGGPSPIPKPRRSGS
jgi:RimJ/RimL family protein N-acetyltransferase